jgi:hypothetical protein
MKSIGPRFVIRLLAPLAPLATLCGIATLSILAALHGACVGGPGEEADLGLRRGEEPGGSAQGPNECYCAPCARGRPCAYSSACCPQSPYPYPPRR